jgi:hypothetical protein
MGWLFGRFFRRLRRTFRRLRLRLRFRGLTHGEIARGIGTEQVGFLRHFFGVGVAGAQARFHNFLIPEGLTRATLERYMEVARRAIAERRDPFGVQRLRRQLCERALEEMN